MTRDDLIRRGHAAQKLLSGEAELGVLGEIEAEFVTEWASSNPVNVEGRESIWRMVKMIELFQQKLESWASAGKVEAANIERDKRDRQGMQVEA